MVKINPHWLAYGSEMLQLWTQSNCNKQYPYVKQSKTMYFNAVS